MLIVWNKDMNAGFGLPPFVDLQKGMYEGSGEGSVAERGIRRTWCRRYSIHCDIHCSIPGVKFVCFSERW